MEYIHLLNFISEPTRIAKLDVAFAVSASSSDASNTLQHFKDIIKAISDTYGTDKIHYGLISYGDSAVIKLPFSSRSSSLERIKNLIDSLNVETGGSDLEEALDAAVMIFRGQGARFDAQKVLVLMTDAKSTGDDVQSYKTAKDLKDDGVNIITVAIAGETDHGSLKNISSNPDNVVNTTTKENPKTVAEKVIERTGTFWPLMYRPRKSSGSIFFLREQASLVKIADSIDNLPLPKCNSLENLFSKLLLLLICADPPVWFQSHSSTDIRSLTSHHVKK